MSRLARSSVRPLASAPVRRSLRPTLSSRCRWAKLIAVARYSRSKSTYSSRMVMHGLCTPSLKALWVSWIDLEPSSPSPLGLHRRLPGLSSSQHRSRSICLRKSGSPSSTSRSKTDRSAKPAAFTKRSWSAQSTSRYGPASVSLKRSRPRACHVSVSSWIRHRTTSATISLTARKRGRCCWRHGSILSKQKL